MKVGTSKKMLNRNNHSFQTLLDVQKNYGGEGLCDMCNDHVKTFYLFPPAGDDMWVCSKCLAKEKFEREASA